jgi:hypothetical protein
MPALFDSGAWLTALAVSAGFFLVPVAMLAQDWRRQRLRRRPNASPSGLHNGAAATPDPGTRLEQ